MWRILKFRVLWKGWIPVIYVRDQPELPCMHCGVTPLPSPSPLPLPNPQRDQRTALEQETGRFDMQAIGYLSYLMLPLVVGGAVYSLVYNTHKRSVPLSCPLVLNWTSGRERSLLVPSFPSCSWYSWAIHSLVSGVYAFGFLFMLPQLFLNYQLKTVAHLPWKAFMYKVCRATSNQA